MDEKKSFFEMMDSKSSFYLGLITAVLVCCTIGFIIMAVLFFKGKLGSPSTAATQPTTPVADNNAAANPSQPTQPTTPSHVNVDVGHFPMQGSDKAKVTVIEFADLRCPYCKAFYQDSEQSLINDYVKTGKIKFYFRSFAFLGPASTVASEGAECANEQGQFWKYYNWMYENQADESNTDFYSKPNLIKDAGTMGLDTTKFGSCLNSDKDASLVAKDLSDGQTAGVSGTPTTFVNGTPLVGAVPYSQVKSAIDAALAQ